MAGYIGGSQPVAFITDSIDITSIGTDAVGADEIKANAVGNSEMADDAVGVAELSASGTASSSTYLRGDNSWATVDALPTQTSNAGSSQ